MTDPWSILAMDYWSGTLSGSCHGRRKRRDPQVKARAEGLRTEVGQCALEEDTSPLHIEELSVEDLRLLLTGIVGSSPLTRCQPSLMLPLAALSSRGRPGLPLLSVAHLLPKGCPESQSWS